MTSEDNLRALQVPCADRTTMLRDMIDYYGLRGKPELDITARDVREGAAHSAAAWRQPRELEARVRAG